MLNLKKGTSVISLVLCAVAITLVTTALVVATNNSAIFRAQMIKNKETQPLESYAYVKVYNINEVESIARQAYANSYLAFYDNEVDLEGLEALVIGEMMQEIPQNQLENYIIQVTIDGVSVQHK